MLVMMALKWIGLIGTMVCIDILPIKTNIKGSLLPVHTRHSGNFKEKSSINHIWRIWDILDFYWPKLK